MADGASRDGWLDLADAVTALRGQIAEAQSRAAGSAIRLSIEEVTMEFGLELLHSAQADGGLRFGVVSAGVNGERTRTATHTVTLRLSTRTDAGGRAVSSATPGLSKRGGSPGSARHSEA